MGKMVHTPTRQTQRARKIWCTQHVDMKNPEVDGLIRKLQRLAGGTRNRYTYPLAQAFRGGKVCSATGGPPRAQNIVPPAAKAND